MARPLYEIADISAITALGGGPPIAAMSAIDVASCENEDCARILIPYNSSHNRHCLKSRERKPAVWPYSASAAEAPTCHFEC